MAALTPSRMRTALGPVEVAVAGTGPAVLLVHGTPGGWQQARLLGEDLLPKARVLLVSRPGYGRTPLRSGRTPEEQAALYAALLDELGLDRAVVMGISGGGPSAYAFAATHPSRCAGLMLCCAVCVPAFTVPSGMARLAAVPGLWSVLAGITRITAPLRRPSDEALTKAEQAVAGDPRVQEGLVDFAATRTQTLRGRGLRNDVRQLQASHQIRWPAGVVVSTIVAHGDADDVVPAASGAAYAAAIPGARLEVLPGFGHALPLFARDRIAALAGELVSPRSLA